MNTCLYSELDHMHEELAKLIKLIADAESQKNAPKDKTKTDHFYERLMKQLKKL